jgi:general secretion pathway protein N
VRPRAIAVLGIFSYAVFLLATLPASVVTRHMSSETEGRVQFTETSGTLWSGAARARIMAPGGPVFLDRLAWRLIPDRLAAGRLSFDVSAAASGLDARFKAGRGVSDWELRDVAASADAAFLTAFVPWVARWRPEGTLAITTPALTADEHETRGTARIEWRNAALALSEVRPLGSYRIEARADGGPAKLEVTTLEGPLKVNAQGTYALPTRLSLSGDARGEGESARALEPLLDLIGPRRPDGARALELRLN